MYRQITVSAVFALLFAFQTSLVMAEVPKTLLVQNALRAAGYHPGPSDGLWGDRTARALSNALGTVGIEQSPQSVEDLTADIFDYLTDVFNLHHETLDLQQARLQETVSPEDARHLISRVGLGAHPEEIQALAGLTRSAAISKVLTKLAVHNTQLPLPEFFSNTYPTYWARNDLEEGEQQNFRMERDKEMANLRLWWVREMLATERPAGERLVLFWHNHFVTGYSNLNENVHVLARQHWTFREYGHTNFRVLTRAMIRDAAMLDYLDNDRSRKGNPNENLARELMELFVLGEGNYKEKTVKEVARALTGYGVNKLRNDEFRFNIWDHDTGTKTIFDKRGRFDGDDVVDILMEHPVTARFVAQKFWKNYISDFNSDPQQLEVMADVFRASDYDIKTLLRETLSAPQFWASENRATLVKSPVDFLVGTIRSTGLLPDWWSSLPNRLEQLGQNLFDPPNVAGWPGGADWLTPSRLLLRNQMMDELLNAEPFVNEDTMVMGNLMISGTDMQSSSKEIIVRYAAEDYQGAPEFQVRAYENDSRKPLWTSKTIEAEGGIDTDLYGRPKFADLNWRIQKFEIPSDLNPDYFSVAFLNDHCCGLSGGDRNFYVDWLAFTGRHYPVAKGKQATQCRDGNETPGSMYCAGKIDFTDFEDLVLSEKVPVLISPKDVGISAERVIFQGSSAFKRNKNWNAFRIGLVGAHSNGIMTDTMVLKIIRELSGNQGYRTLLQISENDCFPDCIGGTFSRSAFKNKKSGERYLEFVLRGSRSAQERRQWNALSEDQKVFISNLWMSVPDMIDKARKGRSWRNRDGDRKFETWEHVFDDIEAALPRSRFAKMATSSEIWLREPASETSGMMSTMSALNTTKNASFIGQERG